MQHDTGFDLDSTGVIPIQAENDEVALEWGMHVAKWYIDQLYLEFPELIYNWSPVEYACWIESSVPKGCEDCVEEVGIIQARSYPEFSRLKQAMQD